MTVPDFGVSDYLAPVLGPRFEVAPGRIPALWATIRAALPRADIVEIARMPATIGSNANPLVGLPGVRAMPVGRFGLPIAGPAADLVQRVTRRSTFRDLGKFRRRLERQGPVRFVVPSTEAEIDALATVMVEQRRARFAELGRDNLLGDARVEDFYRGLARQGLDGGPARLLGLFCGEACIGTAYGFVQDGRFALVAQTMAGGAWQKCSPGILTTAATMEWAVAEGLTYFDFTIGFLPYKLELGANEEPLYEFAEALSARGALALGGRDLRRRLRSVVGRHPRILSGLRKLRALITRAG